MAAAGMAHVVAVLTVFSLSINEDQRYLLPLLPSFLVVLVWLLSQAPQRWFSAVVILLVAGQFATVHAQALHLIPGTHAIQQWLMTPTQDRRQRDELSRLVRMTCTPLTQERYIFCGVDYLWLNASLIAFQAAKERFQTHHHCYYVSLYAQKDLDRLWRRMRELKAAYFISVEEEAQPQPPDFLNRISLSSVRCIKRDPQFVQEPFDSNLSILVFRASSDCCSALTAP